MQTREEYLARRKAYYQANKEKWSKYAKENRDKINKYWREKRAEDPEKYREKRNKYRAEHIEQCRRYQNKYNRSEKGQQQYRRYYSEHKEEFIERAKKSNANHQSERRAQSLINHALERGKIERKPCEVCGSEQTDAHHYDYNKPLDVMWLCRKHHAEWHMHNEPIRVEK